MLIVFLNIINFEIYFRIIFLTFIVVPKEAEIEALCTITENERQKDFQ